MTRWLEAARQALTPADKTDLTDKTHGAYARPDPQGSHQQVKSVKSVLSPRAGTGVAPFNVPGGLPLDAVAYLAFLRGNGPATYGAVVVALGWGATRAWQSEARLRLAGLVVINPSGKAILTAIRRLRAQPSCAGPRFGPKLSESGRTGTSVELKNAPKGQGRPRRLTSAAQGRASARGKAQSTAKKLDLMASSGALDVEWQANLGMSV